MRGLKSPDTVHLDRHFVEYWSHRYLSQARKDDLDLELRLLDRVGPQVAERGYYQKQDLAEVGKWKAARVRALLEKNSPGEVKTITREALGGSEYLRHWKLQALHGVGPPMASALLTVWAPDRYTILDVRAATSLRRLGELSGPEELPDYPTYLACCRSVASELGVGLRDLDRALWQWDKES